jgi:hypothetical protein
VAVNAGRKATAEGGAERGVDGREPRAILGKAGLLLIPLPQHLFDMRLGRNSTQDPRRACHCAQTVRHKLVFGWTSKILTMKQLFASAAKLLGGGSILSTALQP